MPIYLLSEDLVFPPVDQAEDGIVAIGGDLSPERLILAYRSGIFPWYNPGDPIVWWCPDPRFVLFPDNLRISRTMKRILKSGKFKVTYNQAFEKVISNCKEIYRPGQAGTWITEEMRDAYIRLHQYGHAESIEVWEEGELAGGMYGVLVGKVFCGESMFSAVSNASKVALIEFMRRFQRQGGLLLDCQVHSDHLERLGARMIGRAEFISLLRD
jgi:leucyl/phenylalanyl-tRNA--protein transferase